MNVILDACVLYPAPIRDFLLNIGDLGMFNPKWSNQIQEEWISKLLKNRQDIKRSKLERTRNLMEEAFPEAKVKGFEYLIDTIILPDEDDRHILAAAIGSKSAYIVTYNLKDFPQEKLVGYKVIAIHPDEFVMKLVHINENLVKWAFENQLKSLTKPPCSKNELLEILKMLGMRKTVQRFNFSE